MLTALVLLLGSLAAGAPAAPPGMAAGRDDRTHAMALLTAAFARLTPATEAPPRVTLSDATVAAPFVRREAETVIVDARMAELVRTPSEALAFAALALGYAGGSGAAIESTPGIDLRTVAAALAVGAVGDRLDRAGPAETPADRRVRRRYGWVPTSSERLSASPAQRAVTLLTAAGGCTAPFVTLLLRIAAAGGQRETQAAALFARQVLGDLGPIVYLPDEPCMRR